MKRILLAIATAPFIAINAVTAAITVSFSGGGGSPLSITLPAIEWSITDDDSFNSSTTFGIGIAVGQVPDLTLAGASAGGNPTDWSSDGTLTFPSAVAESFFANNNFSALNGGGIIWYGMTSSANAVDGEVLIYAGGTISSTGSVAETYVDGSYAIYLIDGFDGAVVSNAGTFVPEPGSYAVFGALVVFVIVALRRFGRHRS